MEITFAYKTETNNGTELTPCGAGKNGEYYNAEQGPREWRGGTSWIRQFTTCAMRGGRVLTAEEAFEAGLLNRYERADATREWFAYTWK